GGRDRGGAGAVHARHRPAAPPRAGARLHAMAACGYPRSCCEGGGAVGGTAALDKHLKAARLWDQFVPPQARPRRQPRYADQEVSEVEPVSIPARRGTLEDPEVLQNVPGHVIPILQREFDDFKTEATRFLDGDLAEEEFIKFRLKQGVYGQRQPDVQMIRVKLPFGGITPEQMEKFADVIEKYVPLNRGHITTRQNIQMHHVPLLD